MNIENRKKKSLFFMEKSFIAGFISVTQKG